MDGWIKKIKQVYIQKAAFLHLNEELTILVNVCHVCVQVLVNEYYKTSVQQINVLNKNLH